MGYSMLKQLSTIGIDQKYDEYQLSDDSIIGCTLIDNNGTDRYRLMNETFYKQADGVFIVYDITNRRSFEEIEKYYIPTLNEKCKENIVIMLFGNKKDMEDKRKVSFEEGKELASKYNFIFAEVSCFENNSIFDNFKKIIETTYYEKRKNWNNDDDSISLNSNQHSSLNRRRSKCC